MKKAPITFEGMVQSVSFPNKGIVIPVDREPSDMPVPPTGFSLPEKPSRPVRVDNVLPGQRVEVFQSPHMQKRREGSLRRVICPAPYEISSSCPHASFCGGCNYQTVPYEIQLHWKQDAVASLLDAVPDLGDYSFLPIIPSPLPEAYRNKMEYSFGDEYKDGPLTLGLHKRGAHLDIVPTVGCKIVHEDFIRIVRGTADYFRAAGASYHNTRSHEGWLRHLVLRRSYMDGSVLVNLVTSSQGELDAASFTAMLQSLPLEGRITGILHTINDSLADIVQADRMHVLYGEPDLTENLLGLSFRLSPFSFFQTNSKGAEALYRLVREMAGDLREQNVFDLYCGTGTISQIMADAGAGQVIGIEIVEEAVEAARMNAAANGLQNCSFLAGDVLKLVDTLPIRPDLIILDPPRDGIHPKALPKILAYRPERFLYIACKPTSLARDLPAFREAGYKLRTVRCVDMFPGTVHVETVALMTRN